MRDRPYRLGLTGSIGMGKSTTARLFAEAGVPVWDADAVVHRLYAPGGAAVAAVRDIAPDAVSSNAVDRTALRAALAKEPDLLARLEARVHPLAAADREDFLTRHDHATIVVCDIPLLFETSVEEAFDGILVVTAAESVQHDRVLSRETMSEAGLASILARQMPDAQKRARADFVIETDRGIEAARADVLSLICRIEDERSNA